VFQLLFDPRHNVLMTRLYGTYVEADIVVRDNAVARFVARRGLARGIMDFSEVETVDVPMDSIVRRAQAPPVLLGQARVIVAPHEPAYGLNRIIAAHQLYSRKVEPLLVRTLDEAYRALGMCEPAFEAVESDDATRRDAVALRVLAEIDTARGAAGGDERQRLRKKMLGLLDAVLTGEQPPGNRPRPQAGAITLADVLNTFLRRGTVSDADLMATCGRCRRKKPLASYMIAAGRETTYTCPTCADVAVVLAPAAGSPPSLCGYALGTFIVRTAVDIECPGGVLPKSWI
jgi:hypothetical protein